jgi:hypothetical protein
MQTLLVNQEDFFFVSAKDAGGTSHPATFTVTLDDPTVAYAATSMNAGVRNVVHIVPLKPGLVTATIVGASEDGTITLGPYTRQYQFNALPVPQATQLVFSADSPAGVSNAPPNPGTPSVSGSC